jgi:hypothetical protein
VQSQLRKSQKIYGLQITNPQIATFAKVRKSKKKFKSANLQICNLWKLFVDRPPFLTSSWNWQWLAVLQFLPKQPVQPTLANKQIMVPAPFLLLT